MSIRIGDTWWSYERLDPFATALGMMVDYLNALRSGDTKRMIGTPVASTLGMLENKTFLRGIGEIMAAVDSPLPAEAVAKWSSNFSVSWIPNIARTGVRETTDVYAERRIWGSVRTG